jgi:hypothetical protein
VEAARAREVGGREQRAWARCLGRGGQEMSGGVGTCLWSGICDADSGKRDRLGWFLWRLWLVGMETGVNHGCPDFGLLGIGDSDGGDGDWVWNCRGL